MRENEKTFLAGQKKNYSTMRRRQADVARKVIARKEHWHVSQQEGSRHHNDGIPPESKFNRC